MYVMNLFRVAPSKDFLEVALLTGGNVSPGLLARTVNWHVEGYVATTLARGYGDLEPGVYVANLKVSAKDRESELLERLREAFERYGNVNSSKGAGVRGEYPSMGNVGIRFKAIPSTSYVVARLLNNAVEKIVHEKGVLTSQRPGEGLSMCLGYRELEEFWGEDSEMRDERFEEFCRSYPGLCGTNDDECSRFFRVLKCLVPRFQHIKVDDREEIYLVLHSYYRRQSDLGLSKILRYLEERGVDPSVLRGVKVNYRIGKDDTMICDVNSVRGSSSGRAVVVLECDRGIYEVDLSDGASAEWVSLNPSYGTSRRLIADRLCRDFDEHKELNKRFPREYFILLEKDLRIFKRVLGDELHLGGVRFSLTIGLKRLPTYG